MQAEGTSYQCTRSVTRLLGTADALEQEVTGARCGMRLPSRSLQ